MILPPRLRKGDTVGVISPASTPSEPEFTAGINFLEELGLKVTLGKSTRLVKGYLAGNDKERLTDFHDMISNQRVKAIFFSRGGYGTARLTADIDYELVKLNPKIIWGYSDITYLHTVIRQKTSLITFHGPMVISVGNKACDLQTKKMFHQLFKPTQVIYDESISPLEVINKGEARGRLVGGNLSLITSSLGTFEQIELSNKILVLEDVDEPIYKIDSMLNQLMKTGLLKRVSGIVIGDFKQPKANGELSTLPLIEVFHHYFNQLDIPVISGFKIGHCFPNIAFPLGSFAELSTETRSLKIEPGVN